MPRSSPGRVVLLVTLVVVGVLTPLMVLATENCYPYEPPCNYPSCGSYIVQGPEARCKQLCAPYSDTGCCAYMYEVRYYFSIGSKTCPCAGQTHFRVYNVSHNPLAFCYRPNGQQAPCNTDTTDGYCFTPP